MANVKIFPTGPSWDAWDYYRGQAVAVPFDTLASAYPADQWLKLDEIATWPGEGYTIVESDIPGAVGNTVILAPFGEVAQSQGTVAAGVPTGSGIGPYVVLGGVALALFLLLRRA